MHETEQISLPAQAGDQHAHVSIVQSGIGNISENDVKAALSGTIPAVVIGFNVSIERTAEALALQHGIQILTFDIIYKLTEHVEELLRTSTPKRAVEEILGRAKVLKQFGNTKNERVVGGKVVEGHMAKNAAVRVVRREALMGVGKIRNLQTNKQNVDRVDAGTEFGAQIVAPFEIAQGDALECFITVTK